MFITKKKFNKALEDFEYDKKKQHTQNDKRICQLKQEYKQNEFDLKKDLREVVGKLTKISLTHLDERDRWRVITELDPRMITVALERGNDEVMINYIAEEVAYKVKQVLKSQTETI